MTQKNIVLTGVTRGLGLEMAKEFCSKGHRVFGCGRDSLKLKSIQQEIKGNFEVEAVDLNNYQAVESWSNQVFQKTTRVDLLIANAAIINRNQKLIEMDPEEFAQVIHTNVTAVMFLHRAFIPKMISNLAGVIVSFSSGWGRTVSPEVVPYCASKWAIEGLSRGLALELPKGMASIALNPGIIFTDMLSSAFGESARFHQKPLEWAKKSVPFLLSLNSSHNGLSLDVP